MKKKELCKKIVPILFTVTAVLLIATGIFAYKAYDVKNNYYNSEDYWRLSENAYVGGDAYNYIINAGYFTGYSVWAAGTCVGAVIAGCFSLYFAANGRDETFEGLKYIYEELKHQNKNSENEEETDHEHGIEQ